MQDREQAKALKKLAEVTLERLKKTNMEEYPTNTLIDFYDIIHNLMEAITLKEGVKAKGDGAHQELIDYVASKYSLGEQNRRFLQEMRDNRNRVSYEGFIISKNYIINHKEKIVEIANKLFALI
ncbi:hypothetical protein J4443_03535 [Candidatus Woesearchaeota archaeon]|nr:hypothetical protein [Candidatus Woesearchaeota archaeon]